MKKAVPTAKDIKIVNIKNNRNMRIISIVFLFISTVLKSISVYSQDSLKSYIHQAVTNNPLVQSKYNEYAASFEKIPQVGALPDPQLTLGYFLQPMEQLGGNQRADIKLMQMFPWFGTLKASKDEASKMANAKYEQFRQVSFEVIYNVKRAWYDLYRINKEIGLTEDNLRLIKSLEQIALARFSAASAGGTSGSATSSMGDNSAASQSSGGMGSGMGASGNPVSKQPASSSGSGQSAMGSSSGSGSLADLLKIQMEIKELENKLSFLKDQKSTQIVRFNSLLSRSAETFVFVPDTLIKGELPVDLAAMQDSIAKNNPMVKMLESEEASYVAKKQMVTKMGYPMLGIGIDYALIDARPGNTSMMNGKDMIMPMVNISLPIYRKKYKSMVKEAELGRMAASQASQNTRNELYVQYKETLAAYNDAERRIGLYAGQADLAHKTLDLLITGLATGSRTYDEVLRMQQQLLDYRFKLIEAMVDQNSAVAGLENLMGREE